ncbi:hypothetical protein FWJ25_05005 [Marinobacter salinexigens]|uniref:Uncharacterized protein n=1 Tax=Marinobacter salinexigens TaxID=2919747 RepID=A0A5B0VJ30_9GAMM|nr:hypothetical protein [Marinobacter salinexigens]KAA1174750.1 hypothetical protein FWJ25_05005 [Marinobacter salinexigens]
MEPIRPDDDELRAEAPIGSAGSRKPAEKKVVPTKERGGEKPSNESKTTARQKPVATSGGGGKGGLMLVLLVVIAGATAAGWYSQNQRIKALEGQLEEADYWARQSKLALARFEGELSETGESLQESGESLGAQIASNKKAVDTANSEIRKLWVVANERNKARLNEHQERIAAVEKSAAEGSAARSGLEASLEKARSSLAADLVALEEQTRTSLVALEDASRAASDQLTVLNQQVADVDQVVENRIRRFEQEQKLGLNGMESRITALEKDASGLAGADRVQALQGELAALRKTVDVLDSSRSQLTSRLVRLSEEVNALRAQSAQ